MKKGQGSSSSSLKWSAGEDTPNEVYITRVMNYGTWEEWQELRKRCPREEIKRALRHPLRGQWTKRGKAFAEVVFDIELPNDVLISYDV